jgi:hypothetical protein
MLFLTRAGELAAEEGRKRGSLLRRDFHTEHERPGDAEFLVRHEEPHHLNRQGRGAALSLGRAVCARLTHQR